MKKLLPVILFALSFTAEAQTQAPTFLVDSATHKVTYSEVVQVSNATKAELYRRASLWAAKTFPSTDATVQLADAEAGRILVKGWNRINIAAAGTTTPMKLWFTVQIDAKDGRYRSIVTDLEYQGEYNPRVTTLSAQAQVARRPADETLTLHDERTHTKKGELRPVFASYRTETSAAVASLQASIKAYMQAAPAAGVQNSDF